MKWAIFFIFMANVALAGTHIMQGDIVTVSSESITTQLNLPFVTTGYVLFNNSSNHIVGTSTLRYDNNVLTLGNNVTDTNGSRMVIDGNGITSPIYITKSDNNTGGVWIEGKAGTDYTTGIVAYQLGKHSYLNGAGKAPLYGSANFGISTKDAYSGSNYPGGGLTARSPRYYLFAYPYADNTVNALGTSFMILAASGTIMNPSPDGTLVGISTPTAPVHVGYGTVSPKPPKTKLILNYPGDSYFVSADSSTGGAQFYAGVESNYVVVGSTSNADLHLKTNGSDVVIVSSSGHLITSGTAPSITSCGSTPNGSVVGDDNRGTITIGGGSVTSCTLTFANTWGATPTCVITDNSVTIPGDISAISATAFTVSFNLSLGGGLVYYQCGCSGSSCK